MTLDATAAADQSPWVTSYGCVLRLVHRTLQGTNLVMSGAEKTGYSVHHEPAIPTPAGIQRPDLALVCNSDLTILDVTIVADNADLEKTHNDKCVYYDVPAIREWAQLCFEPRHIAFEALAMNWRGLLATRSATAL